MLFSSNVFLFCFLPAVLLIYYLCPRRFRNPVLLIFSLFFYGWGEPVYLFLMVGDILLNYFCGILISREQGRGGSGRRSLTAGVVLNLGLLMFFKYGNFFFGNLLPEIPLPIGISFYIFQSMSYIIDVYWHNAGVQKNVLTFGTYVTLFPQLIAGPIVRYVDVEQMLSERQEKLSQFSSGAELFVIGLSKKVLLANPMGNLWNLLQAQPGTLSAWMGILAYTLQIYFDFSGYSDMAIGLGRMFGFEFLKNFDYPYISRSITEFWRRWHISLSTWFKEYVYIPLGGNRKGMRRQILNILIVWLLTGLWHGASWNFVLWGGYYALLLIAEKVFLLKHLEKAPGWLCHVYTMGAVILGWSFFYFEDFGALAQFLPRLFTLRSSMAADSILLGYLPILAAALFAATPAAARWYEKRSASMALRLGRLVLLAGAMVLCVAALASQSYNPFIYFRF